MENKAVIFLQNKSYWIFLVGFFLILTLPLLNVPPWFSPPDFGKTIVFKIILSSLILFFIWLALWQKKIEIKTSLAFWLLVALWGVFFLATIFSLDPYFSFWGSPYRSGGFLNFTFYIIFTILTFLIIRKKDWQKIWDFAIIIGILVSIIALLQQFGIFSEIIIPFVWRAPSTIGGPSFLAVYLLLLNFLALSFGIKDCNLSTASLHQRWIAKNIVKKIFYFLSFLLFIFVIIFITKSRAAFLGLGVGFLWFLFIYPKRLILLKVLAGILLILSIFGFYFLKNHPEVYLTENKIIQNTVDRILSLSWKTTDYSRFSTWQISLEAIKNRPILGYGPENFSIAFDKYYDPSLPQLIKYITWWDRAHNFIFDITVAAGILALLIYLSLFGVLFWQLQRLKSVDNQVVERPNKTVYHGIQATFLAYLVANFFSFDNGSTYLISFLIIGFSLSLISENIPKKTFHFALPGKTIIVFLLFVVLIWFILVFNIKPLQINKEINWADYYSTQKKYDRALTTVEKVLSSHSFLDHYLRLKYIDIIGQYFNETSEAEKKVELAQKATQVLKENIEINPYYTRNWLHLGTYTYFLISQGQKDLKEEVNYYFEKASQLSPGHYEILINWSRNNLLIGECLKAEQNSQKCINLNPEIEDCWWLKGLSQLCLNEIEEGQKAIEIAAQKGYPVNSKNSLLQLAKVYIYAKNYQALASIYQKLIEIEPNNYQYHGSLATCYKELGQYEKAREEALKVLEIIPEARAEVEKFLRELYR